MPKGPERACGGAAQQLSYACVAKKEREDIEKKLREVITSTASGLNLAYESLERLKQEVSDLLEKYDAEREENEGCLNRHNNHEFLKRDYDVLKKDYAALKKKHSETARDYKRHCDKHSMADWMDSMHSD